MVTILIISRIGRLIVTIASLLRTTVIVITNRICILSTPYSIKYDGGLILVHQVRNGRIYAKTCSTLICLSLICIPATESISGSVYISGSYISITVLVLVFFSYSCGISSESSISCIIFYGVLICSPLRIERNVCKIS